MRLDSSLRRSSSNGFKQCKLGEVPIGRAYREQSKEEKERIRDEDRIRYSEKKHSTVKESRNRDSPFLSKTMPSDHVTQENINDRNEIAVLTEGHPNFAVEIFTGEDGGIQKNIIRKVNGFSLNKNDKMIEYVKNGRISIDQLSNEFDELAKEHKKIINGNGFFHNDIDSENMMLDTECNKVVLIDWENADRRLHARVLSESEQIQTIKEHTLENIKKWGGNDSNVEEGFRRLTLGTGTHSSTYGPASTSREQRPAPASEHGCGVGKTYTASDARKSSKRFHDACKRVRFSLSRYKTPQEDILRKIGWINLKPGLGDTVSDNDGPCFQRRQKASDQADYAPRYPPPASSGGSRPSGTNPAPPARELEEEDLIEEADGLSLHC